MVVVQNWQAIDGWGAALRDWWLWCSMNGLMVLVPGCSINEPFDCFGAVLTVLTVYRWLWWCTINDLSMMHCRINDTVCRWLWCKINDKTSFVLMTLLETFFAVRQARVRISARHPMEVPSTEPTAMKIWRWASANVYEWRMYDCMNVCLKKNKCKKSGIRPPNLIKKKKKKNDAQCSLTSSRVRCISTLIVQDQRVSNDL